ncbi:MAG: 5-carboxymethyl-2-hydroxymuconate isomerase [Pseudomonadota bacterium]
MPHFHIEYSANLEPFIDIAGLCEAIRAAAAEIETFPTPGIRVRATRVDHVAIADGSAAHGFIDLSVRLRGGRPMDVKEAAIEAIFAALKRFVEPAMATLSIALSAEMRDIDPALSPKFSNTRDHLEGGA